MTKCRHTPRAVAFPGTKANMQTGHPPRQKELFGGLPLHVGESQSVTLKIGIFVIVLEPGWMCWIDLSLNLTGSLSPCRLGARKRIIGMREDPRPGLWRRGRGKGTAAETLVRRPQHLQD